MKYSPNQKDHNSQQEEKKDISSTDLNANCKPFVPQKNI